MTSIILNGFNALRAWGSWAGMMIISPCFTSMGCAGDDDLRLSVQETHQGIERCRVLAEPLTLIESKKGDRAGLLLDDGSAHNGTGLVFDQPGHIKDLRGKRFLLFLDRGDHDEGSFR